MAFGLLISSRILGARVRDVELCKHVTRWQGHLLQVRRVPGTQNNSPVIGVVLQLINHLCQLIHALSRIVRLGIDILGPEMAPLKPVDRSQVSDFAVREPNAVKIGARSVSVPDLDPGFGEGKGRGAATDEPK